MIFVLSLSTSKAYLKEGLWPGIMVTDLLTILVPSVVAGGYFFCHDICEESNIRVSISSLIFLYNRKLQNTNKWHYMLACLSRVRQDKQTCSNPKKIKLSLVKMCGFATGKKVYLPKEPQALLVEPRSTSLHSLSPTQLSMTIVSWHLGCTTALIPVFSTFLPTSGFNPIVNN